MAKHDIVLPGVSQYISPLQVVIKPNTNGKERCMCLDSRDINKWMGTSGDCVLPVHIIKTYFSECRFFSKLNSATYLFFVELSSF